MSKITDTTRAVVQRVFLVSVAETSDYGHRPFASKAVPVTHTGQLQVRAFPLLTHVFSSHRYGQSRGQCRLRGIIRHTLSDHYHTMRDYA